MDGARRRAKSRRKWRDEIWALEDQSDFTFEKYERSVNTGLLGK